MDDLRLALRHDTPPTRREIRARKTYAKVLSPRRILASLLSLPLVAVGVAASIYIQTSPYDPPQALAHLIARAGCDAALYVNMAPAYRGGPGYHARNDTDGNGVSCAPAFGIGAASSQDTAAAVAPALPDRDMAVRRVGGAKFVRP